MNEEQNRLQRKYYKGIQPDEYRYKNYGFSITYEQCRTALAEWLYLNKLYTSQPK